MSGYLIIVMIILVLVVVVQLLCKVKFNSCRSIYTYNPKFTTKPPHDIQYCGLTYTGDLGKKLDCDPMIAIAVL